MGLYPRSVQPLTSHVSPSSTAHCGKGESEGSTEVLQIGMQARRTTTIMGLPSFKSRVQSAHWEQRGKGREPQLHSLLLHHCILAAIHSLVAGGRAPGPERPSFQNFIVGILLRLLQHLATRVAAVACDRKIGAGRRGNCSRAVGGHGRVWMQSLRVAILEVIITCKVHRFGRSRHDLLLLLLLLLLRLFLLLLLLLGRGIAHHGGDGDYNGGGGGLGVLVLVHGFVLVRALPGSHVADTSRRCCCCSCCPRGAGQDAPRVHHLQDLARKEKKKMPIERDGGLLVPSFNNSKKKKKTAPRRRRCLSKCGWEGQ
mmetsp:Transcript_10622/g.23437  ORF Transcript_10622/g.23437 Transcript_10622/m.23437 type:complete len:313 (+) Transcript_10622:164-1102(+)